MKKTLSILLCLVMLLTAIPFSAAAEEGENLTAQLVLPTEITIFKDKYNTQFSEKVTAEAIGEDSSLPATDTADISWRVLDDTLVTLTPVTDDNASIVVSAKKERDSEETKSTILFAEITDLETGDVKVQATCKVTVRKSLRVYAEQFRDMAVKIPADMGSSENPLYASSATGALKMTLRDIQNYFNEDVADKPLRQWAGDLADMVDNMADTEDNCIRVDGWVLRLMTDVSKVLNSKLADKDDMEYRGKWVDAYANMPADLTVYTEKSVEPLREVLSEYSSTEWIDNSEYKARLDALAERLTEAINGLKTHTTYIKFPVQRIVKNYGAGQFRINCERDGDDEIEWSTSDKNIAIVNSDGYVNIISAIPAGYPTKTIKIHADSNGHSAYYEIQILNPVKEIEVASRLSVLLGEPKRIVVDIHAADEKCPTTEIPTYEFTSSDETVATVDSTGEITPVATGTCKITVKLSGNSSVAAKECTVTVSPSQKVSKLVKAGLPTRITVNATAEAKYFVYPSNATNKTIKWTSSNPAVATVEAITTDDLSYATAAIKGLKSGTVIITAESTDGGNVKETFEVTVDPLVQRLSFDKRNVVIYIRSTDTVKITPTCQPLNAGNQTLSWFSDDEMVATVVDGKITAHRTGTCTITAITNDGSGLTCSANVRVLGDAESMTLSGAPSNMKTGEKATLTCKVTTLQGAEYYVEDWSVSDTKLASITKDGVLTAKYPGTVKVTATYFDGTTRSKDIKITAPVEGISLPKSITLQIGKTKTVVPTFTPEYASNKSVRWTSSDTAVATISSKGVIAAEGVGKATITVKSEEGGFIANCTVTVIQPVTGVELNKSAYTLTMGSKESVKLVATVSPSNASTKTLSWSSSKTNVATVSNGVVTAKGPGTTVITAKTLDGGFTATCKITVRQPVKGIKFASSKATFYVGQKQTLKVDFTPANASNKTLTFKSSDTSVATVSEKGKVTAKKTGTCKITATAADGGYKSTCTVKVTKKVDVDDIDILINSTSVSAGKSKQLDITFYPDNASMRDVKWTSSDKSIATVNSEGVVTGHKGGKVTIKCTSLDTGVSDKCRVTVKEKVKSITISATSATLVAGKTKILTADVQPSTATNQKITWYSTDKSIATVNSSGLVKAVKGGSCKIVAKSAENSKIVAKCKLTVLQPPTKITISETELEMTRGDRAALSASVKPKDCFDSSVTWKSSDSTVARVSEDGVITAVTAGKAVITCSSTADPSVRKTCNVTVFQPVKGVTLSAEKLTLTVGRTKTLVATVTPEKASNKKVTFKTSDKSVVTVNSKGVVDAVGPGQATVTVRTEEGFYTAKCVITVIEPVSSVSLDKKSTTIELGKSKTLIATVSPSKATNKDVTWRSSNPLVARVTQSGTITAIAVGTAVITCTTDDGGYKASCTVNCIIPVDAVALNKTSLTIKKGSEKTLKATLYPEEATIQDVKWTSSDTSIATVDKYGTVKAVGKGACLITCTTKQGGKKATCIVTVN